MAKGQTRNVTVKLNNNKNNTETRDIELIVKNGNLVPDDKDLDPGVSTRTM